MELISREKVLALYEREHSHLATNVYEFGEMLKDIPVVEERKTGRWVKHDTGHSTYYDCSLCSCLANCTETADTFIWKLSKFCPDCGAKMEGADE